MSKPRRYLFRLGYESPEDLRVNEAHNSDFESSSAVWIEASDEAAALEWGQQIAEAFVARLFQDAGEPEYSWKQTGFAFWIEQEAPEAWSTLPSTVAGKMPDFDALRP
jgi:hypothetical protein